MNEIERMREGRERIDAMSDRAFLDQFYKEFPNAIRDPAVYREMARRNRENSHLRELLGKHPRLARHIEDLIAAKEDCALTYERLADILASYMK